MRRFHWEDDAPVAEEDEVNGLSFMLSPSRAQWKHEWRQDGKNDEVVR